MVTGTAARIAEAAAPILSVFQAIGSTTLRAAHHVYTDGSRDGIILDFGAVSLRVTANEDNDSISIDAKDTIESSGVGCIDVSATDPWKSFIGKPFGWGWLAVNQQGYCDGLLLGFGGLIPQIMINVIASSLKMAKLSWTPGPERG
jgi:hypothetical protein